MHLSNYSRYTKTCIKLAKNKANRSFIIYACCDLCSLKKKRKYGVQQPFVSFSQLIIPLLSKFQKWGISLG